jgi:hypothetical protein
MEQTNKNMTDYGKWERFDESEAEKSIEEQLQAQAYEEQRKKALRNEQAHQKLATRKLKQSSAAIASKASELLRCLMVDVMYFEVLSILFAFHCCVVLCRRRLMR